MTMFRYKSVTCANCGHVEEFQTLVSTTSFKPSDMDFRTYCAHERLQTCRVCGYAGFDLEILPKNHEPLKDLLASLSPKDQKDESDRYWSCGEIWRLTDNDPEYCFDYYINAAWVAEDDYYGHAADTDKACRMRRLALPQIIRLIEKEERENPYLGLTISEKEDVIISKVIPILEEKHRGEPEWESLISKAKDFKHPLLAGLNSRTLIYKADDERVSSRKRNPQDNNPELDSLIVKFLLLSWQEEEGNNGDDHYVNHVLMGADIARRIGDFETGFALLQKLEKIHTGEFHTGIDKISERINRKERHSPPFHGGNRKMNSFHDSKTETSHHFLKCDESPQDILTHGYCWHKDCYHNIYPTISTSQGKAKKCQIFLMKRSPRSLIPMALKELENPAIG